MSNNFDFKNPDYTPIFHERMKRIVRLREDKNLLSGVKEYYKHHPADFINDWGLTIDPRNVERGLPAVIPFILFPKQREWVEWIIDNWLNRRPGITEKTRDMGMSWLSVSLACTLCTFYDGMGIGFGSRKEEYVDRIGAPKSLFYKARFFMENLPKEFRGNWNVKTDAPHMRINFPDTGSSISGEAGDNIGRGDRTGIFFVDEAAYIERPELVEASLSQTTNCRQDISSANGMANSFAQKRHSGRIPVFTFHWRDDPRKDQAWYDQQVALLDPVTIAQEIDINYSASATGLLIPSSWVQVAVDAHIKLGFEPSGERVAALDVADEGLDMNAICAIYGSVIMNMDQWSGRDSDPFKTVQRAFDLCDEWEMPLLRYDADGIGALVRGDARVINERNTDQKRKPLKVEPFRGSAGVFRPEREDVKGRLNKDYFANLKAQAWWSLRNRFRTTYLAIIGDDEGNKAIVDPDDIISIPSKLRLLSQIIMELSQPTYDMNGVGKIIIDKAPEGAKSPNLADAIMMAFYSSKRRPMNFGGAAVRRPGR